MCDILCDIKGDFIKLESFCKVDYKSFFIFTTKKPTPPRIKRARIEDTITRVSFNL